MIGGGEAGAPRAGRDPSSAFLSVVVPCFDEQEVVREMHGRLVAVLEAVPGLGFEVLYVDDGSRDATPGLLHEIQRGDPRVRVLLLSRNFGHQTAITAGVQSACGDAVVIMDADLQDPPEVIPELLERWSRGADVVYGVRAGRDEDTAFKRWTAAGFYRLMRALANVPIPGNAADFRLMDRRVADAFLAMPERDRFVRGMVAWLGFRQEPVSYRRAARAAGTTKYPLRRMLRFAAVGILSFSAFPLRLAIWLGLLSSGLAFAGVVYVLAVRFFGETWSPGWAMQSIVTLFLGGVQLVVIGVLGEYLGRIFQEVKRRPLYVVRERLGFPPPDRPRPDRGPESGADRGPADGGGP